MADLDSLYRASDNLGDRLTSMERRGDTESDEYRSLDSRFRELEREIASLSG